MTEDNDDDIMQQPDVSEEKTIPPVETDIVDDVASDDVADDVPMDMDVSSGLRVDDEEEGIEYPSDKIDGRGESIDHLSDVMEKEENIIGETEMLEKIRQVGSWHNIMFRAITEQSAEEIREREALAELIKLDGGNLPIHRLRNDEGKTLLRTAALSSPLKAGETKVVKGAEALAAFSFQKIGGGYRVPLYNSGISIDILTPTGNDVQTMITNSLIMDNQLGSASGAHYFAYNDHVNKIQIMNFIEPLIVNSSYGEWRKKGKLWQVIKLPDLVGLIATLAALCYPEGYDGFTTKCSRPRDEKHPGGCHHTDTFKANLFELAVTRFSAMSSASIDHMVSTRIGNTNHSLEKISRYQAGLGIEGEKISFGDVTFTMRIPSMAEHQEAGSQFIADVVREIQGDNTAGRYEQFGLRYMRTFTPWIANVTSKAQNGSAMETSEPEVITRMLEIISMGEEGKSVSEKLLAYVNKAQLTYVGFPVTPCPACGYVADTPSGLWTIDPFQAFFTLAYLYTTQPASTLPKA